MHAERLWRARARVPEHELVLASGAVQIGERATREGRVRARGRCMRGFGRGERACANMREQGRARLRMCMCSSATTLQRSPEHCEHGEDMDRASATGFYMPRKEMSS